MLGRITVTRTFATTASPSAVWAALEAAPRWPEVLTDLIEARIEPDGVLAAGAVIRTHARPGTKAVDMTYHVTAAEPRLGLTIETASNDFRAQTEYRIDAFASGARVTLTAVAEPVRWLHKLTTQLARRSYTAQLETALESRMRPMLTLAERIGSTTLNPSCKL
jgi:hypothetical protein